MALSPKVGEPVRHRLDPSLATLSLPHGPNIIIKEDHRSPVVACHVWVRVGSNREPAHLRGWAHGIEHMIFKGTSRRSESDFAREVASAGGSTNAGTGYETTHYHITAPRENFPLACDILADALSNAKFDPASLDAERKVLVHENHMYDDIPSGFGVTWRWIMELAFDRSPYRYPIGGEDAVLLETARDDVFAFYRATYRPDNLTVVAVGDLDMHEAAATIAERFAVARAGGEQRRPAALELPVPECEPPHTRLRYRISHGDVKNAYAKLLFHGPSERSPLRPVLSVVKRILAEGRSARLYREVQEQSQLVSSIGMLAETGPREGAIVLDIETDVERLARALRATVTVLESLKNDGPTAEELSRAQKRVLRAYRFNAETVQDQASQLGYFDAIGDLDGALVYPARVNAVTRGDVMTFCRQVFRRGNLSCLVYLPEDAEIGRTDIPGDAAQMERLVADVLDDLPIQETAAGAEEQPLGAAVADATPAAAAASPAAVVARHGTRPPRSADGQFTSGKLAGGLPVYFRVDRSVPVVTLALYTRGGACHETALDSGTAALTQLVQVKGSGAANSQTLHEKIESEGASLAPRADRDYGGLFLSALSENLDPVLAILGDLACRPSFPADEIDRERRLALDRLRSIADDPFQHAVLEIRRLMFGDHPYGRPLVGTEESLPRLERPMLQAHHDRFWRRRNLQLVVSGDFDPAHLLPGLEQILAGLPNGTAPEDPAPAPAPRREGMINHRLIRAQSQSMVLVAWPGPPNVDTDRVELLLWKQLLNGQSGRLFEALRNQRSLCYNTGVLSATGLGPGFLVGYVLTDPDTETDAAGALIEELTRSALEVTETAEFERARAKLVGNLMISNQSNSARTARCARDLIYGRDTDDLDDLVSRLRDCEATTVRDAAARYLDPENFYQVVVAPDPTA